MSILTDKYIMGLGTSRLPIKNASDEAGIEKSAKLVLQALNRKVNYIDTSYPYASGGAHKALKLAFEQTDKEYSVTIKVLHQSDKTADEARSRADSQLSSLGIPKADFFVCWSITTFDQFMEIMSKNGVYDGALKLKDEGVIKHICCSLHTAQKDSIKILESGAFAAATISLNYTNAIQALPVLDFAYENNIDIAIMNPLGGGGIAQNPEYFSFAHTDGESTVTSALRFAKAHPAVKVVLSGLSNENELDENIKALTEKCLEPDSERLKRIIHQVKDIEGYCVNCHYCDGCPAEIPISEIIEKRNKLLFGNFSSQDYRRSNEELRQNINLFFGQAHLESSEEWFPYSYKNPCTKCGLCESKCTQKLKIIEAIDDMYIRAEKCGFSLKAREERLQRLLRNKGYKKVGLYPKDRFADEVVRLYNKFWGTPDFKWIAFNSDSSMWGRVSGGFVIKSPAEIPDLKPDAILVCNYTYQKEIFRDLKKFKSDGIDILKLHREMDVPWVF